jgi:hypothetical protein
MNLLVQIVKRKYNLTLWHCIYIYIYIYIYKIHNKSKMYFNPLTNWEREREREIQLLPIRNHSWSPLQISVGQSSPKNSISSDWTRRQSPGVSMFVGHFVFTDCRKNMELQNAGRAGDTQRVAEVAWHSVFF